MLNKDLVQIYDNLYRLRECSDIRFPAKVSFCIMRNIKILLPTVEAFEFARTTILQTYGAPAEDKPGFYKIDDDKIDAAMQELTNLENIDIKVEFQKIKLQDIESLNLSIQDMDALYPMLEEE